MGYVVKTCQKPEYGAVGVDMPAYDMLHLTNDIPVSQPSGISFVAYLSLQH